MFVCVRLRLFVFLLRNLFAVVGFSLFFLVFSIWSCQIETLGFLLLVAGVPAENTEEKESRTIHFVVCERR